MRAPVKHVAILAAAVSTWAGVVGCDDQLGNDKQVRRAIVESREAASKGDTGRADALKKLQEAADNKGASPAASAQANAVLAAAEVAEAGRLMKTVDEANREIGRLVYEIGILGQQIANSNQKIAGYRASAPTAAQEDAKKKLDAVQGGGDKAVWIEAANANVPTLAAVKQDVSRLQGEIAKKQDQIKQLEQQRQAAVAEADKNRQASENEKGNKSVETFKIAAAAQKKADDIGTQIDVVQASIIPLQRDLAVAESHQAAAAQAIESLNKQIETINGGWKGTEQQIATQAQIAANLVGAAGGAAPAEGAAANTINDKAQLLSQKVLEAQAAFNEADSRLDNAIKHYGDAASAAQKLASEVNTKRQGVERNSPYYKAFDDLMATVNAGIYKLGQAEAQQLRATAHASQAISLIGQQRMMQTLQPILAEAKLEMPQALTGLQVDAELERTKSSAAATYDEALKQYEEVSTSAPDGSTKQAASVGRIFANYGKVLLARATGDTEGAAAALAGAKQAQKYALENKSVLPAMPVELVIIPTSQPATAPTTAPAATSAPAEPGAAPAEPGTAPAAPAAPAEGATPAAPAAPAPGGDAVEQPAAPAAPAPGGAEATPPAAP
jgi:chromosome segregation ATPase